MYSYHKGELFVQQKANVVKQAARTSRIIQEEVDFYAQGFIQNQLFCFVSSMDKNGKVWISILTGKEIGFAKFKNSKELQIDLQNIHQFEDDILYKNLKENSSVGFLFIDLATRRRFRLNGNLFNTENQLNLQVDYAFPNCPKYIQQRALDKSINAIPEYTSIEKGENLLPNKLTDIIKNADTFYVGTADKNNALDASHRGGQPGFIEFFKDDVLKIPDYSGNNMFISLGNIHEKPEAGLLFIDDASKSLLQLQGKATIDFNNSTLEDNKKTGGTGRFWYFKIEEYIYTENIMPYTWQLVEYSP